VYGDRFRFIPGDSKKVLNGDKLLSEAKAFDIIHIDGGHSRQDFLNDIGWFLNHGRTNALILVDDAYAAEIKPVWKDLMTKKMIREIRPGMISNGECRLFQKIK